jgi:oligopeptidase B
MKPPRATQIPHELTTHEHVRVDPYYWLRERDAPEVIEYLEAENAYTDAVMAPTKGLQERLFEEIKGRIQETDLSVPYRDRSYFYYHRYEEGKEYPVSCRKKGSLEADEDVILDDNELAERHEFLSVGRRTVSSGEDLLAYAVDTVGRRQYTVRFKDLKTGTVLADELVDVTANLAWAEDNRTLFYTQQDPETLRANRVFRHVLGTEQSADTLVYEETDETFRCHVQNTKSRRFLLIGSSQTVSTEYRYLDASDPTGEFAVVETRARDHEYAVGHFGEHFYVLSNLDAKNFRLLRTPTESPGREHWEEVIPHRADVLLEDFDIFRDFLVVSERRAGLTELRVVPWSGEAEHYLEFDEPAYLAYTAENFDFDTLLLRFRYTSLTTPMTVYDYDMKCRERILLKREPVLGDFSPEDYVTERLWAVVDDGTEVPISLVRRADVVADGKSPLLLYGYGSYGHSIDPFFSAARLSLLDRGFVFAIAHIRGGEELGRAWYEDGKLLRKRNTFTDFVASAEHLIRASYADPKRVFAAGGSAGGLLMGAVVNLRPDLFLGVHAAVPFVDVVTTMLDGTIPLTTSEYDEWGNPNEKEFYEYILSYSPYDNVRAVDYPHLLVTTGLHDSQVQYFEPAKWVAKLRELKTDQNRLLLKTEMSAGHGGVSGRYQRYHETAFEYAFFIDLADAASELG